MLSVALMNVFLHVFGRIRVWRDPLLKQEVVMTRGFLLDVAPAWIKTTSAEKVRKFQCSVRR